MSNRIITSWNDDEIEQFGHSTSLFEHSLTQQDLASDAAIIELLDNYPRNELEIQTSGNAEEGRATLRSVDPGDHDGATLLNALHTGRFWFNLRRANHYLPKYESLCADMFGELDKLTGLKSMKRDIGILISSRNACVHYHLDIPLVSLWQLRGEKTIYLYPAGASHAPDHIVEAMVLGETEQEYEYLPEYEHEVKPYLLTPGKMISWAQTAPHRVVNGDSLNVSLSCEFQTWASIIHANTIYTNGILRRTGRGDPYREGLTRFQTLNRAARARLFKARGVGKEYATYTAPRTKIELELDQFDKSRPS